MDQLHLLSLLCIVIGTLGQGSCPLTSSTTVAYYSGSGATSDCQAWERNFWDWWQSADSRIQYKALSANHIIRQCNLLNYPNLKVYTQPGGNAYDQQLSLGSQGKQKILNYIDAKNGIYLGTCAGWFYASTGYIWQGTTYKWNYLLGRYPETEGSITTIQDYDKPPGYRVTGVTGKAGELQALYFGGATRGWRNTPRTTPGSTLLTFADIPDHLPAAVQDGNLLLFSVHLEAFRNNPSSNITDAQVLANYRFRAEAINTAAGTDWRIPTSLYSSASTS